MVIHTCNNDPLGRSRSENVIRMYPGCSPDIVSIVNEKEEQQEEGNPGELTSPMWFIGTDIRVGSSENAPGKDNLFIKVVNILQ